MSSTQTVKQPRLAVVSPGRFVRIGLAADLTGYSREAIETKIKRGVWLEGHEYIRAPDTNILIDMEGYHAWAAGQRQAG